MNWINLDNCIMNASGALCRTEKELLNLNKSDCGIIISKTCTWSPRKGNESPRYYGNSELSINSMGLPNLGFQFYQDMSIKITKPYFVSISPMNKEYFNNMLTNSNMFSAIEVNLSCPNIIGKPQIGYDFEETEKILRIIATHKDKIIGLKLPPYFDPCYFDKMAQLIKKYNISFITCINSLGNGLVINPDTEKVVIKPKDGIGGIGGSIIKPIALSNVYQFRKLLDIPIFGCGGIKTGMDIFEHILVGATAVQIGTTLVEEGVNSFYRLKKELKEVMEKKKYKKLEDFRGKIITL